MVDATYISLQQRDETVSELKASLADMESRVKQEQARNNDLEIYYQEKMQEVRRECEVRKGQPLHNTESSFYIRA